MIGRAVRCSSGRPTPPRPGRSGRPSPWAARSFPVLIGAAAVLIGAGSGQKKSQGGRRRPFTLAFSFLLLIEAGRVLPGAGGGRNIRVLCPALPGYFPAFPRGGCRQHPARAGLLIRQAGQAGRWAKEKGQGRRRGVRCCSGLWSALAAMVPAGCVPVPVVGLICWRCRWAWSALAPFPLSAFQRHGWRWRCSIRVNFAVCRRGQILHLTAYRPIGNGELGSMPPYYPPLAPFFPGFRRGESITGHSFGTSL